MRIRLLQSGRIRDAHVQAICDDYRKRFRRYGSLQVETCQPHAERGLWPVQRCWKVLVDEHGASWSSPQLAERLARWSMQHGTIALAIGGADGHDERTRRLADAQWSLGPLVLPHQLAHLLVIEQCYRAGSILAGDPYHRD
ncbi:MAG: 23S rRNA (pseudouridine(1915)-N(3))-methyltransferase RlmH [Planctomycetota bacterium]